MLLGKLDMCVFVCVCISYNKAKMAAFITRTFDFIAKKVTKT